MAPAAKKLAGCNKSAAGLAGKLAAKTASLKRCTTDVGTLNSKLRCACVCGEKGVRSRWMGG